MQQQELEKDRLYSIHSLLAEQRADVLARLQGTQFDVARRLRRHERLLTRFLDRCVDASVNTVGWTKILRELENIADNVQDEQFRHLRTDMFAVVINTGGFGVFLRPMR